MFKVNKTSLVAIIKEYFYDYKAYKLSDFYDFKKVYRCHFWSVYVDFDTRFVFYQAWGAKRFYLAIESYDDDRSSWVRLNTASVSPYLILCACPSVTEEEVGLL